MENDLGDLGDQSINLGVPFWVCHCLVPQKTRLLQSQKWRWSRKKSGTPNSVCFKPCSTDFDIFQWSTRRYFIFPNLILDIRSKDMLRFSAPLMRGLFWDLWIRSRWGATWVAETRTMVTWSISNENNQFWPSLTSNNKSQQGFGSEQNDQTVSPFLWITECRRSPG